MKCIVCYKKIPKNGDVCEECDKIMTMLYKKHPKDKEKTLNMFREADKKRK
jgi:predicted nucleic acid-binding Zn ribbon protein